MTALLNWMGYDDSENEPSEKPTKPSDTTPVVNSGAYVTRQDMMDAMEKMQQRIEDRLQAERNKRVDRLKKLADDLTKRVAELDGNMARALQEHKQEVAQAPASAASMAPADVDRLAQILAEREPRLAALVGHPNAGPPGPSGPSGPSGYGDGTSMLSGVSDSASKFALLEELKSKVERLEKGSKKLVAAAAEALVSRGSDDYLEDGGIPSSRSLGNISDDAAGFDDKVVAWTTKLDNFETDNILFSRIIADVEIKLKAFDQELDRRVQASVKKEIKSLGLDRGG